MPAAPINNLVQLLRRTGVNTRRLVRTLTKGDLQFLAGFQNLHDRMVSLLVKANVPGKLNNPAYQAYGPVHPRAF